MNRNISINESFDFEGDYGEEYEALARALIPGYLSSFRQAVALLEGRLGSDAHVLVVGAGTGIEIITIQMIQPAWRCTGVDPSSQMVEIARDRIFEADLGDGVDLRNGYVHDLPADVRFDAATCFNVMHFLEDDGSKERLLQSISNRLDPGAPFILFDLHGTRTDPEYDEQYAAWRAYWRIQGMNEEDRAAFQAKIDMGIRWIPESRIFELLKATSFVDVRRFFRGLLYGGWIARHT
jgi:tRNA (cmo5U34)-methyltransferase